MAMESVVCYSGDLASSPSPHIHWSLCTWPSPPLFEPLVRVGASCRAPGMAWHWVGSNPHPSACQVVHTPPYAQSSGFVVPRSVRPAPAFQERSVAPGGRAPGQQERSGHCSCDRSCRGPRAGPAGGMRAQHAGRWVVEVSCISEEGGGGV